LWADQEESERGLNLFEDPLRGSKKSLASIFKEEEVHR
jgi:hypothetical protein